MYKLFFDGSKKDNIIGYGYIIYKDDQIICQGYGKILNANKYSSNFAEYIALILALQHANLLDIKELEVYGDSLVVINQINGKYRTKSKIMKSCLDKIIEVSSKFAQLHFWWIPRKDNNKVDRLTR